MKIFTTLALIAILTSAQSSLACQPAPEGYPTYKRFEMWTNKLLTSPAVLNELEKIADSKVNDIFSIVSSYSVGIGKNLQMKLNNGCQFDVEIDSSNAATGSCPETLPLKITNSTCG